MPPAPISYPGEIPHDSLLNQTSEFLTKTGQDEDATRRLFERWSPMLQSFLHGRLPASARNTLDTVDLAQGEHPREARNGLPVLDARQM